MPAFRSLPIQYQPHFPVEFLFRKLLRRPSYPFHWQVVLRRFEPPDRPLHRLLIRRVEQEPPLFRHDLEHPPTSQSYHRPPTGDRLDSRDSKIFFPRHHKRPAPRIQPSQFLVRNPATKLDIPGSPFPQPLELRPIAGDLQPPSTL